MMMMKEGLRTFNTPKYRQFAKRLGQLIRHTVHYVSANWDTIDTAMALRLQVGPIPESPIYFIYYFFYLKNFLCSRPDQVEILEKLNIF